MEANKRHGNAILIEEYVGMWTVEQIQSIKKRQTKKYKRKSYVYKNRRI